MCSRHSTLGGFKDSNSFVVPTPYLQDESVPFLSPSHSGYQSGVLGGLFFVFCFLQHTNHFILISERALWETWNVGREGSFPEAEHLFRGCAKLVPLEEGSAALEVSQKMLDQSVFGGLPCCSFSHDGAS